MHSLSAFFHDHRNRRRDVRQRSRLDFERPSGLYVDTPKRFRFLNAEWFGTLRARVETSLWSDLWQWFRAIIRHWIAIAGGAAVAVIFLVATIWGGGGYWLQILSAVTLFVSFVYATFLAWRDEYRKTLGKERRRLLEEAVELVINKPLGLDSLGGVIRLSDKFRSEEDVEWVCQQLDERDHLDPFGVLGETFQPGFDGKRLKFLQDARVAPGPIRSISEAMDYIGYTWGSQNGLTARN